jgi:hypothetical protein
VNALDVLCLPQNGKRISGGSFGIPGSDAGAAMDQQLGQVAVASGRSQLQNGLAVASPGIGVGGVDDQELRHSGGHVVVGMVHRGQQRAFGAGAQV